MTAGVLLSHAAVVLRFGWVNDDAYISFRFARNFAWGEGLRFNVWDQPAVERYSNSLWVVLAGGVHALGLDRGAADPLIAEWGGATGIPVLAERSQIKTIYSNRDLQCRR